MTDADKNRETELFRELLDSHGYAFVVTKDEKDVALWIGPLGGERHQVPGITVTLVVPVDSAFGQVVKRARDELEASATARAGDVQP